MQIGAGVTSTRPSDLGARWLVEAKTTPMAVDRAVEAALDRQLLSRTQVASHAHQAVRCDAAEDALSHELAVDRHVAAQASGAGTWTRGSREHRKRLAGRLALTVDGEMVVPVTAQERGRATRNVTEDP